MEEREIDLYQNAEQHCVACLQSVTVANVTPPHYNQKPTAYQRKETENKKKCERQNQET